jgi:hypothetical protein
MKVELILVNTGKVLLRNIRADLKANFFLIGGTLFIYRVPRKEDLYPLQGRLKELELSC